MKTDRNILCPHCGERIHVSAEVFADASIRSVLCPMCSSLVRLEEAVLDADFEVELRYPRRRILVVEDSRSIAMMLKDMLEDAGYDVAVASNGKEALEAAEAARPDVLLLDLKLPDEDGFQVLGALHRLFPEDMPPVLVTSGAVNAAEVVGKLRGLGARGFINKEALFDTVLDRLHAVVAGAA